MKRKIVGVQTAVSFHGTLWKDVTNYSRYDEVHMPTSWEVRYGTLRICITCGHIIYRPNWVMHCAALGINTLALARGLDKEGAQREAVSVVETRLEGLLACLAVIKKVTPSNA